MINTKINRNKHELNAAYSSPFRSMMRIDNEANFFISLLSFHFESGTVTALNLYEMKGRDIWHNQTNVVSPIELFTRLRTRFCAVPLTGRTPVTHTYTPFDINVIGTFYLRSISDKHVNMS